MDPGTYLSIAGVAFQSAVFAVKAFRKGLSFSRDAERLVLRLEVERFRLQMWGENCGLATVGTGREEAGRAKDEGDSGGSVAKTNQEWRQQHDGMLPRLLPLCDVLRHQLDDVAALFREHDALSERYGLEPTTDEPTRSDKLAELVARMQRSFRRSRPRGRAVEEEKGEDEEEEPDTNDEDEDPKDAAAAAAAEPGRMRRKTSTWNKIRWSVLDLAKFEALVAELAAHVTRLNQLLAESSFGHHHYHQHHPPQPDANDVRVSIVVVGSAVDRESIDLVRSAVASAAASPASASALLRSGIERKAISADLPASLLLPPPPPLLLPPQPTTAAAARGSLRLADFALPDNFPRLSRFLAERKGGGGGLFLFERKDFDRDISPDDKRRLTERIRRLVVLLGGPRDPALLTPRAEGCIHDAEHYCWWLVFCFTEDDDGTQQQQRQQQRRQNPPTTALTLPLDRHQPISLRLLIDPKTKFRPPLEQRYALASALAGTLSELYRSSWLHKGIRSDNILFQPSSTSSPSFSSSSSSSSSSSLATTTLPLPPDFHRRPLLCGFDYTRHESEWATIDRARRSPDVAAALYRHPAYQGAAAQGYSLRYDLYSLGLVLLEVALWAPLSNFLEGRPARATSKVAVTAANGTSTTTTTTTTTARAEITLSKDMKTFHEPHARLLRRHVLRHVDAELAFRAGSPYRAAVGYCLGGDDDADGAAAGRDDDPWSVPSAAAHPALEFYDRVVVPLARLANAAAASA
ncbi:hypothetical protein RB594_003359 [Gaeumannomyces avenae]